MGGVHVSSQSLSPPRHCLHSPHCRRRRAQLHRPHLTELLSHFDATDDHTQFDAAPPTKLAYFNDIHSLHSTAALLNLQLNLELVKEMLGRISNGGIVALAFFRWAKKHRGFKYTTESFHGLVEALGKIKQFRHVWNMVDAMKIKGLLTEETFILVARRYARAKKVKEAIDTLEKMPRFGLEPPCVGFQ